MKSQQEIMRIHFPMVIFCLLAFNSARADEPTYDSKALSEWLGDANPDTRRDAIRKIGSQGIPTLLDILGVTRAEPE